MSSNPHEAHGWMWQAHGLLQQGKVVEAADLYERAQAVFQRAGMARAEAEARANLGVVALHRGDQAGARHHLEAAVGSARALGDARLELSSLDALAGLLRDQGDLESAASMLDRAVSLAEALGEARPLAGARLSLASLQLDLGAQEHAIAQAQQAHQVASNTLDLRLGLAATCLLAAAYQDMGDLTRAGEHWALALDRATAPDDLATARLGRAAWRLLADDPDLEGTRRLLEEAARGFGEVGDRHGLSGALCRLAVVAHRADPELDRGPILDRAASLAGDHPIRTAAIGIYRSLGAASPPASVLPAAERSARLRLALRLCRFSAGSTP